jgi:hypothetical protein
VGFGGDMNTIKAGDKVAYSRKFLSGIADYSADSAERRGLVTKIQTNPKFAEVKWEDESESRLILTANLVLVSKLHLEPR